METQTIFSNVNVFTVGLCVAIFACILTWIVKNYLGTPDANSRPLYTLPPGPPRWPLLGNIPGMLLAGSSSKYLNSLVSKFGPVFTLYMGPRPVVVLNKYTALKEALLDGHLLSNRGDLPALDSYFKGRGVIGSQYTTYWKKTRSFVIHSLRQFGVDRRCFESVIASQADNLINDIRRQRTFDPLLTLQSNVCNVICGVVFGKQYQTDNPRFIELLETMYRSLRAIEYAAVSSLLPGLHYLPGCSYQKFFACMDKLFVFFRAEISEHEETLDPDHPRDVIDMYLSEIRRTSPEDPNYGLFSKTNLEFVVNDLFMAGTETSATVIYWALLMISSDPNIQARLHQEIDDVTSCSDHVTMSNASMLPYTMATIEESLRFGSVAISSMRSTTSDMTLGDYRLEVGTWIMLNYEYSSFDPECWSNPKTFNPERFLDADGQFQHDQPIVSFSMGKRNCLGEKLARMELFIFFTNIMKNFEVVFPEDAAHPTTDAVTGGMMRVPHRYRVTFKDRSLAHDQKVDSVTTN